MKKTTAFLWVAFISAICIFRAEAFVRYEDKHPQKVRDIRITGFIDYAPFGYTEHPDAVLLPDNHEIPLSANGRQ